MSSPGVGPTGPENPGERKITEPAALVPEEMESETGEQAELLGSPAVGPTGPENP